MGIDCTLYRIRIGGFEARLTNRQPKKRNNSNQYQSHHNGTDVHLRTFVCGIYLIAVLLTCHCFLTLYSMAVKQDIYVQFSEVSSTLMLYWSQWLVFLTSVTTIPNCTNLNGTLVMQLLLLSGDIELNPGPGPGPVQGQYQAPSIETQMILQAIADTNSKVTTEIQALRNNLFYVRSELKEVKSDITSVKDKLESLDKKQTSLGKRVKELEHDVETLQYDRDMLINDMEGISNQKQVETERFEYLEAQVNLLESEKLKCSLRVFGLEESECEDKPLSNLIDDEILSVVKKSSGKSMPISSAKRVGKPIANKHRMVIVEFEEFQDKLDLFKFRDELRTKNIRISNDLTYRQRQIVKTSEKQGFRSYFKNGKLYNVPTNRDQNSRGKDRRIRTLDDRNRELLRKRAASDINNAYSNTNEHDLVTSQIS